MAGYEEPERVDPESTVTAVSDAPSVSLVKLMAPSPAVGTNEEEEPGEALRRLRTRVLTRRAAAAKRELDEDDIRAADSEIRSEMSINTNDETTVALLEDGPLRAHIDAARQRMREAKPRLSSIQSAREAYAKALGRISGVITGIDEDLLQSKKEDVEWGFARAKACEQFAAKGAGVRGYQDLPLADLPEIVDVVTPALRVAAKDMLATATAFDAALEKVDSLKKLLFAARRDLDVAVETMFVILETGDDSSQQQAELARLLARADRVLARPQPDGLARTQAELLPSSLQARDRKGKGRAE